MADVPVSAALAGRFSPLSFDPEHTLSDAEVEALLEAARWAPSAGNSQPWAFHVRRRGEAGHRDLVRHLAGSSRRWAPDASVLIVNLAHPSVEDSGMEYSEFAEYDLGQAVAHLTIQAHTMGLACRQFRAFDLEALHSELRIEPGWRIVTMLAVGASAAPLPDARVRRTVAELMSDGRTSDG